MIKVELILEDTHVVATRPTASWEVVVRDIPTGESATHHMSDTEFAAMCALAIHGDGEPIGTEECYKACEHFFTDAPNHLRPIP